MCDLRLRDRKGLNPATCPKCGAERAFRVLYPDRRKRRQTAECTACGWRWQSKHPEVWDVAMHGVRSAPEGVRIQAVELDGTWVGASQPQP